MVMMVKSTASADNISSPKQNGRSKVDAALAQISNAWKGNSLNAARTAASEIGMLNAGGMLAYNKADEFWKRRFAVQLVDEKWWSTVHEAFQSGRSSLVTMDDLLEKYFPVAANDNEFFEPTVFEWQDPSEIPLRDWIYGKHLIRRHVSATIASGAVGKPCGFFQFKHTDELIPLWEKYGNPKIATWDMGRCSKPRAVAD